jgi:hypothetical protein
MDISSYLYNQEDQTVTDPREQAFHNIVREYLILTLILLILYGLSYLLISSYRRRREEFDDPHSMSSYDIEDAMVCRVSLWMCTFSLAISMGAALLLPFSVVTNEVLIIYPDNYYFQWLNEGLVQSLWNKVFVCSNISLFILLPFAYFFTESEGFSGSRKGIMSRVNESIVLLLLLTILVFGMTYLLCLTLGFHREIGFKNLILVWHFLPFLYSCVSFLGVLFLLVCTPVGIARLFTVLGELVVKPRFLRNIQEEYDLSVLEEMHLQRRIETALRTINDQHHLHQQYTRHQINGDNAQHTTTSSSASRSKSLDSLFEPSLSNSTSNGGDGPSPWHRIFSSPNALRFRRIAERQNKDPEIMALETELLEMRAKRKSLESQKRASAFRRNFVSIFELCTECFHD